MVRNGATVATITRKLGTLEEFRATAGTPSGSGDELERVVIGAAIGVELIGASSARRPVER
ncbi:MAG TPA: hypothetical protein VFN73_01140 [Propionibacteriaceae bacterium]|nr:hypothetical protein [Propionibacteriaceae bacterium]